MTVVYTSRPPLSRFLDTNGNGTGTKNANGNYSGAVEEFFIAPPAGETYYISNLVIFIGDTGTNDHGQYGNGVTLTNGIEVKVKDASSTLYDLTDGDPVLRNMDWCKHVGDRYVYWTFGSGDQSTQAVWTFAQPLALSGDAGTYLAVELNDDLSGVNDHYFKVNGYT